MAALKKIVSLLLKKDVSISTAESCSGGYLSYLLTKTPGSSKVFKGGVVVYSLESKHIFFNIGYPLLIETAGVSADVARMLAIGIKKCLCTDIGVSIVGFAGPSAQKKNKIGCVFIALAYGKKIIVKKYMIKGNRQEVRKISCQKALSFLYKILLQLPSR